MNDKERRYARACSAVRDSRLSKKEAAIIANIGYRQFLRIYDTYLQYGEEGLCHQNRGKAPPNAWPKSKRSKIARIYRTELYDFNPTHACELLHAEYSISISPPTLRAILREYHIGYSVRKQKTHRAWRKRMASFGELLQGDGSHHHWFGPHSPACCLMALIDDATGRIAAYFSESETENAMMELVMMWIRQYGVPRSLYLDRKNTYVATAPRTIAEQLTDTPHHTDFTRACSELGCRIKNAHSPQAKGRVERVNRTLQERLIPLLRRAGIATIAEANRYLQEVYIPQHNRQFQKTAANGHDAHAPLGAVNLNRVFRSEAERTIRNDWTISWQTRLFQLHKTQPRYIAPRMKVIVERWHDGSAHIMRDGSELLWTEIQEYETVSEVKKKSTCDIFAFS